MFKVHVNLELVERLLTARGRIPVEITARLVQELSVLMETLIECALLGGEGVRSLQEVLGCALAELIGDD